MYLSDIGLNLYFQNRLELISESGFQTYYQHLLKAYANVVSGNSGVVGFSSDTVPKADGVDVEVILDYDAMSIFFQISAYSESYGSLFSGEVDPFGNILRFTSFYPVSDQASAVSD